MSFKPVTVDLDNYSCRLPTGINPFWHFIVTLYLALLGTFPAAFAQTLSWQKQYNGPHNLYDEGVKVKSDALGNAYVASTSESDIVIIKYDSDGAQQWVARYDSVFTNAQKIAVHTQDQAADLVMDAAGNLYVTGTSYFEDTCGKATVVTLKYNSSGVRQWKVENTASAACGPASQTELPHAALDGSGHLYLSVSYKASSQHDNQLLLQKLTPAGGEVWKRAYQGTGALKAIALEVDEVGNAYLAGADTTALLLKYDQAGVLQWQKPVSDVALVSVESDVWGNAYLAGSDRGDFVTIKYDAAGVEQWRQGYNHNNGGDQPTGLLVDNSGNAYVTGTSYNNGNCATLTAIVFKYDSQGVRQWVAGIANSGCLDTDGGMEAPQLAMDSAQYLYVAVSYRNVNGNTTLKTLTPSGVEVSSSTLVAYASVNALHVDASGNAYATGTSDSDILILKYAAPTCPNVAFVPATGSALPPATVGQAYRQAITTDSAGYVFTASGLPAGLSISVEGIISGTPMATATARDSVMVTAWPFQGTCQAQATYSLVVNQVREGQVVSFTLMDAGTGKDIGVLQEGAVLNLLKLPEKLTIRANTDPVEVSSVVFGLNDQPDYRVENFAPYALASNNPDDSYVPFPFQIGQYTLSATPYTRANGQGERGVPLSVHFQVIQPQVASFTLINATTDEDIQPLKEGDVLDLAALPARLSVRANTQPQQVGSVVFGLNDKPRLRVENVPPYALASNKPEDSFLSRFGSEGSGEGQLQRPSGMTIDGFGHLYVADAGNHRIVKFSSSGRFLSQFGSEGSGEGQFCNPVDVAVDGSGHLYVADECNHRIVRFDTSGRFLSQLVLDSYQLPQGVAMDGYGNLYSTNSDTYCIIKQDFSGNYLGGGRCAPLGEFEPLPALKGVAVDGGGNVYAANASNNRIVKFDSSGNFLFQFGRWGSGEGQFNQPYGVTADSAGNVYVSDAGNNRIQKFNSSGHFLSQFGSQGSGDGQFQYPIGVESDGSGKLYVADMGNHRIQVFSSNRYLPYPFRIGTYTLSATPYSQANGQGEQGLALTVNFQVVNSATTARSSVGEAEPSLQVMTYPNPFSEQVYAVIRSSRSQPVVVQCYDAKGVAVGSGYQGELEAGKEHRVEINGRTWPEGLYFLRISTRQQQLVRKVMLQRK